MKRIACFLLAVVMICVSFTACKPKFDQELYDTYFPDKMFYNDGRILTFYDDNTMSYYFKNGMGKTFFYLYSIDEISESDGVITMSITQEAENNDSESKSGKKEEVYYDIEKNLVSYSKLTYRAYNVKK